MKALAVDLGGTHASCAIVEDRKVLRSEIIEISGNGTLALALPRLAQTLKRLVADEKLPLHEFSGIALGFCGLVDFRENRVISTNNNYEDSPNLDLQAWSLDQFKLPLYMENDARMALLGEWYAGAAVGFDDVVMVTLGTGIGGAAMIEGRLLVGRHFQAGCLGGHFPVRMDGEPCTCGAIGCAESVAAGWSLPALCRNWAGFPASTLAREEVNFETLFRHADAGDPLAIEVRDHCLNVWGSNAVALIHAYDPDLVVYGGGVMRSGNRIVKYVQKYVTEHAWTPWGKVQVLAAALGNDAALLGAVPLIADRSSANVR